jgi:hypothetical protein
MVKVPATFSKQTLPSVSLCPVSHALLGTRFIVDREHKIGKTKDLPKLICSPLKGYIADFDEEPDAADRLFEDKKRRIIVHLLSPYQPGTDDFITIRHCFYMLDGPGEPWIHDAYFIFLLHSSMNQQRYPIPQTLESRTLPAMPYILDSVLVVPAKRDFVSSDRQRLAATVVDFLAAIDHLPAPHSWNRSVKPEGGSLVSVTSVPRAEEEACHGYVNFVWQYSPQSAMICAEAVSPNLAYAQNQA